MDLNLLWGISLVMMDTLVGSSGALLFKYSSQEFVRKNIWAALRQKRLYLGFLLYGVSSLIFVYALRFGDLSALYPVAALSYVWIFLLSIKFLKEKMNIYKIIGIFLIILGVIFVSLGALK